MSEIPTELKFTSEHEWVRVEDDGAVVVGITDYAQEQLGDLVFVETPEAGASFVAGDVCAVVESVKAASDIYAPVAGAVVSVNEALQDSPELISDDPYGAGWLFRMTPEDPAEWEDLLDSDQYGELLES
ncbi:MAG: glycine cleavage system protein GcvH [Gammaproteobacteria bacterium]|nr:glycine cleavage system protein GcvH [Gammaproteobacteria bacterium]MCY4164731.1 glycine cleavage system protein GcvH [Gammaproteobacteria bacterium]MCY4256557.1 glycine cleavage system protein GcvH [Gammaproteobacteria bacterium]MCY4340940.1 glycine cleavage system protein GcvH [Gammaproteobacteria bacterium]